MARVLVEGGDASALDDACDHLRKAITKVRRDTGTVVEIMIVGDFNRHDQIWGGDDVSLGRQGVITCMVSLSPVASDSINTSFSLGLGDRGSDAFSVASRAAGEPIEPFRRRWKPDDWLQKDMRRYALKSVLT